MRRAPLIALGAAVLLVAGCGGGDEDAPAATSNAGAGEGGALEWALSERPVALDPLLAETGSERLVSRQIHEPLVERLRRPFGEPGTVPGLASAIRPSRDFRVWELRLRPGVRFQDGTPLNAQAVLANVERWQDAPSRSGVPAQPALFADTPKPGLVRFILDRPDRDLDRELAAARLGIVAPAAIARVRAGGTAPFTTSGTGTGPFELRERSGIRVVLARNAAWWGERRGLGPALDQIGFTVVPAAADRVAALTGGTAQVAGGLDREGAREVRADPLLTAEPAGRLFLGLERSVRGISAGDRVPPLNPVWLTRLETG